MTRFTDEQWARIRKAVEDEQNDIDKAIDKLDASLPDDYGEPDKPEFRVGQIVKTNTIPQQIGQIVKIGDIKAKIRYKNGWWSKFNIDELLITTPAETAEFYTVEIAGFPMRAYKDVEGRIMLIDKYGWNLFKNGDHDMIEALLEKADIPIMPYREQGNFEPPKGS